MGRRGEAVSFEILNPRGFDKNLGQTAVLLASPDDFAHRADQHNGPHRPSTLGDHRYYQGRRKNGGTIISEACHGGLAESPPPTTCSFGRTAEISAQAAA